MCEKVVDNIGYDFFFFKQKTAYGWGSRDWSSDVCSADLNWKETKTFPKKMHDVKKDGKMSSMKNKTKKS